MSKSRVYGKNITVFLGTNENEAVAVCDFDSIDIVPNTQTVKYRGVGKHVEVADTIVAGYDITLSRARPDNALFAFNLAYENLLKKGFRSVNLTVVKTTNYNTDIIDTKQIITTPNEPSMLQKGLNVLGGKVMSAINTANSQFNAQNKEKYNQSTKDVRKVANRTGQAISDGLSFVFGESTFSDKMKFVDAVLGGYSSSVQEAHETDNETIKVYAPEVIYETSKSQEYYNKYVSSLLEDSYQAQYSDEWNVVDLLVANAQKMLNSIGR